MADFDQRAAQRDEQGPRENAEAPAPLAQRKRRKETKRCERDDAVEFAQRYRVMGVAARPVNPVVLGRDAEIEEAGERGEGDQRRNERAKGLQGETTTTFMLQAGSVTVKLFCQAPLRWVTGPAQTLFFDLS